MDALELLTADHNRVRGLFTRFKEAEGSSDREAVELADMIFRELEVHTAVEEKVFYPTITEFSDEIHELVTEGIEEHHVVDNLMAEARGLLPADETWVAKVKVLIENVEHHAEEEEQEMFPLVRKAADAAKLEALAARMEAKKRELGAPIVADKEHLSTEQLTELAKEQQIPGRSSMKREELLATVAPQ